MATRILGVDNCDGELYISITDNKNRCYVNVKHKELLLSQLQSEIITIPNINKTTKAMRELFIYFLGCELNLEVNDDIVSFLMEEADIKSRKEFFNEIKSDIKKFGLDDVLKVDTERFDLDDILDYSDGNITVYGDFREKFSYRY